MSTQLSSQHSTVLQALCDTIVPDIKVADDPTGFWARTATDLGVNRVLAVTLTEKLPPEEAAGLIAFLDVLGEKGFVEASQAGREKILWEVARSSPEAGRAFEFYKNETLLLNYGLPNKPLPKPYSVTLGSPEQNPNWPVLGYPGPLFIPPDRPKKIKTITPEGPDLVLDADVCVVGAGAGGGVISATLAEKGHRVVVLEGGGHYNSTDFNQLELWGYEHLWWNGGATLTANGTVNILAGATMGGGTAVNWMNSLRTPASIRKEWAEVYGLTDVNTEIYDRYLDSVERRISVTAQTSLMNGQNARLFEGSAKLGLEHGTIKVNAEPQFFNPTLSGFTGFGDPTRSKQSTRRNYLRDAFEHGARFVVHCKVDRVLVENGRTVGVEGTYDDKKGTRARVRVKASNVVVSCGSIESPALLLRSGIGGPAVGKNLHLHPGGALYGVYEKDQEAWWGWPQTAFMNQYAESNEGFGFLLETPAFGPGFVAAVTPWTTGAQHKEIMTKVPRISTFIFLVKDRGTGEVTIDHNGNPVPVYDMTDEVDQRSFRIGLESSSRIHEAAGAEEILFSLRDRQIAWKRGDNLDKFIATILKEPIAGGAQPQISAHQMSTCRMGRDPQTSVADPWGELHDTKGVWIGDASAFPTASGANPMITIMALALRTAERIASVTTGTATAPAVTQVPTPQEGLELMTRVATNLTRDMAEVVTDPLKMFQLGERFVSGFNKQSTTCHECGLESHDSDADHCKSCGAALPARH